MRRVYNKPYCDWPEALREELYLTNFGSEGFMQTTLASCFDVDTFVMLDGKELIGWALVDGSGLIMFYVKEEHRCQGVAKRLGERIRRKYRHDQTLWLHMEPHDTASHALEASLFSENLVAD